MLDALDSAVTLAERALDLLTRLRSTEPEDGVPDRLLRLAVVEAAQNRALLDSLPSANPEDPTQLYAFAHQLQLEALMGVLLEWRVTELPALDGGFIGRRADYEDLDERLDRLAHGQRILSLIYFIVVRSEVLRRLSRVPEPATRPLKLLLRLNNLKKAHASLLKLMHEETGINDLLGSR